MEGTTPGMEKARNPRQGHEDVGRVVCRLSPARVLITREAQPRSPGDESAPSGVIQQRNKGAPPARQIEEGRSEARASRRPLLGPL